MGTVSENDPHHLTKPKSTLSWPVLALSLLSSACFPARNLEPNHELIPDRPITRVVDPPAFDNLAPPITLASLNTPPINRSPDLSLPTLSLSRPARPLIMMGGGEPSPEVIKHFCAWSNPLEGEILVIAWGSSIPDEYFEDIAKACTDAGATKVTKMPAPDEFAEFFEDPIAGPRELLSRASGLFLAGGKQVLFERELKRTGFSELIRQRFEDDSLVIAGTSAGTAIASAWMIAGSGEIPEHLSNTNFVQLDGLYMGDGISLISNAIFDQHFSQRGRLSRLITATQAAPENIRWGIGVDESTAAMIIEQRYVIPLGNHAVTIVTRENNVGASTHYVLAPTEIFDLKTGLTHERSMLPHTASQVVIQNQQGDQFINYVAEAN
jgi:cyanophycinase